MKLEQEEEIREFVIFRTDTHFLRLSKEKLDKFADAEKSAKTLAKLRTFIQKSMRQSIEICKGEDWEQSFQLIFKELSGGQEVL